ncbi:MAG TPA: branched-chain-amino-acid transaminase [Tepidisphaeraceae bacterium]|jgi:branched-chain amino acid aminotransferase|nr:branched-chain-amino-acid transaminase [Tepidisphaeraceae bacterium]
MSLQVWVDGKLVDKERATVSVYDHGLLYGDGVFEGIRLYAGKIFRAEEHMRRLYDSAKAIRLVIPYTAEQLTAAIYETANVNKLSDCYVRLVVTRGVGALGIDPAKCKAPAVFIITDLISIYPKEQYEQGVPVIVSSIVRNHPNALSPRIKSLNYLNNVLARMEATDAGVAEAIMLNHLGNVSEGTVANIFLARDGAVFTPLLCDGILEGVTRNVIIELCQQMDIPIRERVVERHDLYISDECFLTGSGAEVMPVTKIDGRPVGNGKVGPITKKLMDAFHKHVRGA